MLRISGAAHNAKQVGRSCMYSFPAFISGEQRENYYDVLPYPRFLSSYTLADN
jgi:hypothetical protein